MTVSTAQNWNPEQYAENASFVPTLGAPLIDLLSPQPGERVLDLGCGDGALTIKLLNYGCRVFGVDSSSEMISAAKAKGLNAEIIDGQKLQFNSEFDAVFSNAALHWMKNQKEVITGVWRALKPGGRFVAEMGGYGNISAIVTAIEAALSSRGTKIVSPWYFPRPEDYRKLLESKGFTVKSMTLFPRPTRLSGELGNWLETFAQPLISALSLSERKLVVFEVIKALRPILCDKSGNWTADYVRLRFSAKKLD